MVARRTAATWLALVIVVPASRGAAAETPLRLPDLERLALEQNPTVTQALASVAAADGRRRQATLLPNPTLIYEGEDLRKREFVRGDHHTGLLGQTIVVGGKLKKAGAVADHEKTRAGFDLEAQRQRVRNAVRSSYYELLVTRGHAEARAELLRIAHEAAEISEELFNVGQADRPDALAAEIEARKAEAASFAAEEEYRSRAAALGAVVGDPTLDPARVLGELDAELPGVEPAGRSSLLARSPEVQAARARADREQAAVARAGADRFGDLRVEIGYGYDYDRAHGLGGWTWQARVAVPLPLFDRAQGRVAEAQGRAQWAAAEVRRVELALGSRFASELARYRAARGRADAYRTEILPRAEEAVRLYEAKFKEVAAAYPQVLNARRAHQQARVEYLDAAGDAWRHLVLLEGFLLEGGLTPPGPAPEKAGEAAMGTME